MFLQGTQGACPLSLPEGQRASGARREDLRASRRKIKTRGLNFPKERPEPEAEAEPEPETEKGDEDAADEEAAKRLSCRKCRHK